MASKLSRRQFLAKAGLGAAGVALAACQPQTIVVEKTVVVEKEVEKVVKETVMVEGTPQVVEKTITQIVQEVVTATPEPATPKPVDTGPLRVMFHPNAGFIEYFEGYHQRFSESHGGVEVELIVSPVEEFPQKLLTGIAAGNPPDVFRAVNVEIFSGLALGGVLLPLDDLIERDDYQVYLDTFLPGSLDAGRINGKQYGIPWGAHPSSYFLFYNKTALSENGFTLDNKDWTWSEYVEIARAMTDKDNGIFGAWIRANFEGFVVGLRSMGAELFDETGTKSMIASEKARNWWEHVYKMIVEYQAAPVPTEVGDWKPPLAAGQIMMANDNGYRESWLRNMVEDFEWDVFVLPNESDKPRGTLICNHAPITAASNHIDLAWEWYKGLLDTDEAIVRRETTGTIPQPTPDVILSDIPSPYYEFYVREWIEAPPLPSPVPANGRVTEVFNILQQQFDTAWLSLEPLDAVIETVDKTVQSVLDKPAV